MRIRRGGPGLLGVVGAGFLTLVFSQAARAQVKLEFKFPEGQKLTYKTTVKLQHVLTLMGQELSTEVTSTTVDSDTVGMRRDDSTLPVVHKPDSMRLELSAPGGLEITYDSSDPKAKIENDQIAFLNDVFKVAREAVYTIVLDGQNKFKAIEGAEKLMEQADKLDEQAKAALHTEFHPDKLKRNFEQAHRILPDVLARPGDTWERTESTDIGGGQTLTFRKKYEYVGTQKKGDKTLDKITSKATEVKCSMDADNPSPLKMTKSDLKVESSDGTILFDREAGYVVEAQDKTQVKGSMTFSINDMEISGDLNVTLDVKNEKQPAAK
jgi:Family of unknown function (DUF6263)